MTEREFCVNAVVVASGTQVYIDSDELNNLSVEEVKELVISKAIDQDQWEIYEDSGDMVEYEVEEE